MSTAKTIHSLRSNAPSSPSGNGVEIRNGEAWELTQGALVTRRSADAPAPSNVMASRRGYEVGWTELLGPCLYSSDDLFSDHPNDKTQNGAKWRHPMSGHLGLRGNILKDEIQNASCGEAHDASGQLRLVL